MRLILFFTVIGFLNFAMAAQRTVCTAAINSTEEIQAFKNKLAPQGFKFVELVPKDLKGDETGEWFKDACKSGVQCDVLLISGHFGGEFFGSSKARLPLELMQQQSCAKTCDGILRNPKEVFLFGCNTLADKGGDSRTPEQYRDILIKDGFDRNQADQVVAIRYSSIGGSFKSSMLQVFEGVPVVNGFDSAAPSGAHVKGDVINYLKNSGDYQQRITDYEGQKVSDTITKANRIWKDSIHGSRTSCVGMTQQDQNLCKLFDEHTSRYEKLLAAKDMLNSADTDKYLLAAGEFVSNASKEKLTSDEQNIVDQIKQLPIKDKVLKLWPEFKRSAGMQRSFANILKLWRDDSQVTSTLIQGLKTGNDEVKCASAEALAGTPDLKAQSALIQVLMDSKESPHARGSAASGLSATTNTDGRDALVKALADKEKAVQEGAAEALIGIKLTPTSEKALTKALSNNEYMVSSRAAKALSGTTNVESQHALVKLLNDSQYDVSNNAYESLAAANPQDPAVVEALRQFKIAHPNY